MGISPKEASMLEKYGFLVLVRVWDDREKLLEKKKLQSSLTGNAFLLSRSIVCCGFRGGQTEYQRGGNHSYESPRFFLPSFTYFLYFLRNIGVHLFSSTRFHHCVCCFGSSV